jgi:hypothetical protein
VKLALQGLVVLAAVLVFGGCTALRFTYNNANSLIRYMAWDYVELDDAQSAALQQRVAGLHEWHRANELPMYAEFIEQASARVSKGTTQKDVAWAIEAMRKTYKRMASRSAEEAAPILVTLRPEQIAALEKRLAKNDAKFVREWLSGSAARRERHAMERMVERFEEWTGGLTKPQRDRIERFVRAHPRIQEVRLEDRRRWQKQAVGHIKEFKTAEELASRLASLFSQPDASRNDDYTRETHSWQNDLADLLVDLDRMLSVEQRSRVIRRMARYADDFRALSKGGAEARAPGGASIWFSSAARP